MLFANLVLLLQTTQNDLYLNFHRTAEFYHLAMLDEMHYNTSEN